MGDVLGSPRVAFPFFSIFRRYDSLIFPAHPAIVAFRTIGVRGSEILQEAVAQGPRVVSGCLGARIRGRSRASMWDAIIPALKHRIPSELQS